MAAPCAAAVRAIASVRRAIVGVRVEQDVRAGEAVAIECRDVRERAIDGDAPMPAADPEPSREVVHPERAADQRRQAAVDASAALQHRHQEREHRDEVRRILEQQLALRECLVDESELALVEVAEATMHELGALAARARREVVPLHERGPQTTRRRVERDSDAGDAATDDEHVEVLVAKALQRAGPVERGARHRTHANRPARRGRGVEAATSARWVRRRRRAIRYR